ncbi:MAG: SGNH/GDSL hydrolase family protein [Deltaproteobacteria bacterium]|nr:SGNH/GDSL hydrolase family protein [Deltaproteobacteria bacterium]
MRMTTVVQWLLVGTVGAACASNKDPFAGTDAPPQIDAAPQVDAPPVETTDAPTIKCAPTPTKLIVFGDSITDCSVVGGDQDPGCVSKIVAADLNTRFATAPTYSNPAFGGAVTSQVPTQIDGVQGGPGHVLALIYIGGNDLAPYIFQSDTAAMNAWTGSIKASVMAQWNKIFQKLGDTTKFPDGVTVLMNTQYNPFDDCTAPPDNVSQVKSDILHQYNDMLKAIAAAHPDNTIIVDQYPEWLGHGRSYEQASCPHYIPNAVPYMKPGDLIHAGTDGNKQLAKVIGGGLDRLYKDCTP